MSGCDTSGSDKTSAAESSARGCFFSKNRGSLRVEDWPCVLIICARFNVTLTELFILKCQLCQTKTEQSVEVFDFCLHVNSHRKKKEKKQVWIRNSGKMLFEGVCVI